jgi:hypothetical protein
MTNNQIKFQRLTAASLMLLGFSAIADESKVVVVRMTKEEVAAAAKAPTFIKSRDLSDVLADKLKLLAVTITERQGGSNKRLAEISAASNEISRETYYKKLSVLQYEYKSPAKADMDGVRVHLLGQTRKSVEVKFKEAFPIVDRIRQGLTYNYSFDKKAAPSNTKPATPEIKYGLVATDIEPMYAPGIASLGSITDHEYQYSRPARIKYTIDKLEADQSANRVFQPFTTIEPINPELGTPVHTAEEIFKKPSTDLNFKIEAANSEESVSDKVEGGALPGAKVTLSQVDGLVSVQVVTTSKLKKESLVYDTRLPLYGEASITRKYSDKFLPIQTSAANLLGKPTAPKLNIHHTAANNQFKGELLKKTDLTEWGISLEPRAGWTPGEKSGVQGDKVAVTYRNNF